MVAKIDICPTCGEKFHKKRSNHVYCCRRCRVDSPEYKKANREWHRRYRKENPEEQRERVRDWYRRRKEKLAADPVAMARFRQAERIRAKQNYRKKLQKLAAGDPADFQAWMEKHRAQKRKSYEKRKREKAEAVGGSADGKTGSEPVRGEG